MDQHISRRFFLGSAAAVLVSRGAFAAPPDTSLRPVLRGTELYKAAIPSAQDLVDAARLDGQVAFSLADAQTGAVLEERNPQIGLPPASVTKAVTALYALDVLGPDHRFETRLIATGGVQNGEVLGDLVLVGGGDPTLNTDALATMAANLKAAGIIGVKGNFKVYEGALPFAARIDTDQPEHVGYNPAVSGVALNFNRVHFEWKRGESGYRVTMDARTARYRPEVAMAAMQVRDRRAPVYTYADGGARDNWTVARGALGKNGSRWLPVRKPGLYAGDVFASMAGSQGIRLSAPTLLENLPEGAVLVTQRSDALREILRDMLLYSTNLTAEMAGLAASIARGAAPASLTDSAREMSLWAAEKLAMRGSLFVDHSGLGESSRVTAQDMRTALVAVYGTEVLRPLLKAFTLRDSKGRPVQDHPIRTVAKTGTLNFVSALAGYVETPKGRVLAFAIFTADEPRRAALSRAQRERPDGGRSWNSRAKTLQRGLIERWGNYYVT